MFDSMVIEVDSEKAMKEFGANLGRLVNGGEIIELRGDVGAGKTTLVKGLAKGMGIEEDVQSPSFTISRVYPVHGGVTLAHYDFYRLSDPGIMANELEETTHDDKTVTVLEWANVVEGVLPKDRLTIDIEPLTDSSRRLSITSGGKVSRYLEGRI